MTWEVTVWIARRLTEPVQLRIEEVVETLFFEHDAFLDARMPERFETENEIGIALELTAEQESELHAGLLRTSDELFGCEIGYEVDGDRTQLRELR